MTDFWCRDCWRENATAETRARYPTAQDVPRREWWPVHCWAAFHEVNCIQTPEPYEYEWMLVLVQCLVIAGALQHSFYLGCCKGYDDAAVSEGYTSAKPWEPGCGLPA